MKAKIRRTKNRVTQALLAAVLGASLASCGPDEQTSRLVQAQTQAVTVRVLIEKSYNDHADCGDTLSFADLYWNVFIDGVEHSSSSAPTSDDFEIGGPFDVNKEFSQTVDVSKRFIPIVIQEWDSDSALSGGDDHCDIDPGPGKDLGLSLDLATCQVSGDASGTCGTSIALPNFPTFVFKITVDEPPHAEGLAVRCLHDPIWPQPGDQVTLTAEALDGNADAMTGVVDEIEIWADVTTAPASTTSTTPGSFGASTLTFQHAPATGADQVLYRCRVKKGGVWVSSGWRIVQIGDPPRGRAVPLLYSGVQDSRLDIVFIPDARSYTGPHDPRFLADVQAAIQDAYYASSIAIRAGGRSFLFNQDAINFWAALDTGTARDASSCGDSCEHDLPPGWDTTYGFADSGAIVHRTPGRDFAQRDQRIFSVWATALDNYLHELGHSPVGLADEYCCDGGYFQSEPYPNIYSSYADCVDDPITIGVTDACQTLGTSGWYRVESAAGRSNDLMEDSGNHNANPAESRQLNWYFDLCRGGAC